MANEPTNNTQASQQNPAGQVSSKGVQPVVKQSNPTTEQSIPHLLSVQIQYSNDPNLKPTTLRRATEGSIGYDLCTAEDFVLPPGYTRLVRTGLFVELPPGVAMLILPRSGRAVKERLEVVNSPGLIDRDYRDEVRIGAVNNGAKKLKYEAGDALAQVLFVPIAEVEVEDAETGDAPRTGGFGSTDEQPPEE